MSKLLFAIFAKEIPSMYQKGTKYVPAAIQSYQELDLLAAIAQAGQYWRIYRGRRVNSHRTPPQVYKYDQSRLIREDYSVWRRITGR